MIDDLLPIALVAAATAFLAVMASRSRYTTIDWTARGAPRNPGTFSPSGITLHYAAGTQGGDPEDVLTQLKTYGYSYNYMIDRDGTRYQLVPDTDGSVHTDGTRNRSSFGIAFLNIGPAQTSRPGWPYAAIPGSTPDWPGAYWEPFTSDQIASAAGLVRELGAGPDWYLIGHQDVNSDKSDPGPAFPWSDFEIQSGMARGLT